MVFVRPSGVIAVAFDSQVQVGVVRNVVRLAIVVRFERGEFDAMFFDQVGEFVEQFAAARGVSVAPFRSARKRTRRCRNSLHNILSRQIPAVK